MISARYYTMDSFDIERQRNVLILYNSLIALFGVVNGIEFCTFLLLKQHFDLNTAVLEGPPS